MEISITYDEAIMNEDELSHNSFLEGFEDGYECGCGDPDTVWGYSFSRYGRYESVLSEYYQDCYNIGFKFGRQASICDYNDVALRESGQ